MYESPVMLSTRALGIGCANCNWFHHQAYVITVALAAAWVVVAAALHVAAAHNAVAFNAVFAITMAVIKFYAAV